MRRSLPVAVRYGERECTRVASLLEDYGAEIFWNMVGIAVHYAGGLPAQEMALGIAADAIDAIQISSPLGASFHMLVADGREWNAGGCVPNLGLLIDAGHGLPTGSPALVVTLFVEVDGEIDPIACRRDFELAVVAYVFPVVAEKHFNDVAIPKFVARTAAHGRQPEVQHFVRTLEQEIQIFVGPETAHRGIDVRIFEDVRAILHDNGAGSGRPQWGSRVGVQIWLAGQVMDGEAGGRLRDLADFLRLREQGREATGEKQESCFHGR